MYRTSGASRCPACGSSLSMLHSSLPAAGCQGCGGVWLGPEATMHILQGIGDPAEEEVSAASLDLAKRSIPPAASPVASSARACPQCGVVMSPLPIGTVVVESCPAHGTFFDRNEVADVVSACHRLRAQEDAETFEVSANPAKKSTTQEMVALVARLLHDWIHS